MNKIASFTVNHLTLLPGIYVSRKDKVGEEVITTFDIRMTAPNREPVINTAEIHTMEHLGATFLRNHKEWAEKVIYFGPMGCRTRAPSSRRSGPDRSGACRRPSATASSFPTSPREGGHTSSGRPRRRRTGCRARGSRRREAGPSARRPRRLRRR